MTSFAPPNVTPAPQGQGRPMKPLPVLWAPELDALLPAEHIHWLWNGYLAHGQVTLLTSQWKLGKTTLLSHLLAKMATGGPLGGQRVVPGNALVMTEESPAIWKARRDRLDLGGTVGFLFDLFKGKPRLRQWQRFIARLVRHHEQSPFQLFVIDPLAAFLPGHDENQAGGMLRKLLPLRQLTRRGVAVLLLHHPTKSSRPYGMLARGSGALSAFVDITVEMREVPNAELSDRRRWLVGCSRHEETPRDWVIELDPEGKEYVARGGSARAEYEYFLPSLMAIFASVDYKLTFGEFARLWNQAEAKQDVWVLDDWLSTAVADGLLLKEGQGTRQQPHLYWLAERGRDWVPTAGRPKETFEEWLKREGVMRPEIIQEFLDGMARV